MDLAGPAAAPVGALGQTHGPQRLALFHHRRDEDCVPQHVVDLLVVGPILLREVVEHRPHHRLVVVPVSTQQGGEIRDQPLAKAHQAADVVKNLKVHPRLIDRPVVVPGVDREAWHEDAAADPAGEQLRIGAGACEAADVVADVGDARQGQPQPHRNVPAQGLPRGGVVAGPGLGVALHPRGAGAGDKERRLPRRMLSLRLPRGLQHQKRLQRLHLVRGERRSEPVGQSRRIAHLVLVVVVPGGGDPDVQKRPLHIGLPPGLRLRPREVDIAAGGVPELLLHRRAVLVRQQQPGLGRLLELRVIEQESGLDIGDQLDPRLGVGLHKGLWVRELVAVPMEHIALVADGGVAGREVKRRARNIVFGETGQELPHLALRVRRVRIAHGRAGIAQRPVRRRGGAPGQPGEAPRDVGDLRPRDDIEIKVAVLGLEAAIGPVIVAVLAAKVEGAVA